MRRRASLAMLMGLVALLAVGLAAMKAATETMWRATFALGLLALLIGTLGAIVRRRGAWTGFALFGWTYALIALSPPIRDVIEPILKAGEPIDQFVDWLHPGIPPVASFPAFGPNVQYDETSKRYLKMSGLGSGDPLVPLSPAEQRDWDAYLAKCDIFSDRQAAREFGPRIGHVIAALVFGCLGALSGHLLDERSRPAGMPSDARVTPTSG